MSLDVNTLFEPYMLPWDLAEEIVNAVGTPTYVYDIATLQAQIDIFKQTFPAAKLAYAAKANSSHAILNHMARQGLGAEVITIGELSRAFAADISPQNMVLGGPAQPLELRQKALELAVGVVSIDSVSQARDWLDMRPLQSAQNHKMQFVLRINPALDPHTHAHLATGASSSKFGMTSAEAMQLAPEFGKDLLGFHIHAGSQIDTIAVYDEIFACFAPLYDEFPHCRLLDIGGGFAVPKVPLAAMAQKIHDFVESYNLELIVEPGRALVATCGCLLTRVLHTKQGNPTTGGKHHAICNAGMADILRPALYNASHPITILSRDAVLARDNAKRSTYLTDVDGPLCENADRLAQDVALPELQKGDVLAVGLAGAYGMGMASNYASSLRPAEVIVGYSSESKFTVVRQRETVADLCRLESSVTSFTQKNS